jgi:hypothetical protein
MDLFNQPLEAFNGNGGLPDGYHKSIAFQLSLHNSDTGEQLKDRDGSPSDVRYRRHKTPMLHDVVPNQVYKGQKIQWLVNPVGSLHERSVESDKEPIQELRIGGALTDWEGLIDSGTRPAWYDVGGGGLLTTIVGGQPPAKSSEARARFRVGDSYMRHSAKHCNWEGDECWHVRTHPVIDAISASEGYVTGGQELKISGFGLNGTDVQVTVDGVPCKVTSNS